MLSNDPAVTAGRVEVELLCHDVAETGRVQVGTRANDAMAGEPTEFPCHIGQYVHWRGRNIQKNMTTPADYSALLT